MPKTTIVVYVEGGLVNSVYSDAKNLDDLRIIVADYDKHSHPEYSVCEHDPGTLEEMDESTKEAIAEQLKEEA